MDANHWKDLEKAYHGMRAKPLHSSAGTIEASISSTLASVLEVAADSPAEAFERGASIARKIVDHLSRSYGIDKRSADYLAGRASALAEVMEHASSNSSYGPSAVLSRETYPELVLALVAGPLRNIDLMESLGRDKGHLSRLLKELRALDIVKTEKVGRSNRSSLTAKGAMVAKALQSEHASIDIISMHAASLQGRMLTAH